MCVMSMIMDHYTDEWSSRRPRRNPYNDPGTWPRTPRPWVVPPPQVTDEQLAEFKRLLDRAREYDKLTGQPDCELDEKRKRLKDLARELGVEIGFL